MITATVKYNDNYTDIEFPCSEAYLSAKLMEIHVDDLSSTTQYISAITEPNELSFLKNKMINLDEINYLAKRMDSFFGDEETQFFEAIKLEHFTEMKDLINLTFNLDKYTLIKDVSDMGKVGREYLLNTEGCIPAHDEDNPKYARSGANCCVPDAVYLQNTVCYSLTKTDRLKNCIMVKPFLRIYTINVCLSEKLNMKVKLNLFTFLMMRELFRKHSDGSVLNRRRTAPLFLRISVLNTIRCLIFLKTFSIMKGFMK